MIRTKIELLNFIASCAGDYYKTVIDRIKIDQHMNGITDADFKIDKSTLQRIAEAVIIDFINFVGMAQGVDYGMYTRHLPEELKKNQKLREDVRKEEDRLQTLNGDPIVAHCPVCYQKASTLNPIFRDRVRRLELVVFVCHQCKLIFVDRKTNEKIIKKWNGENLCHESLKFLYGDYYRRLQLFVHSYVAKYGYKKKRFFIDNKK